MRTLKLICALVVIAGVTACVRPKPVAINYGEDVGAYCGMMITDSRYGSELVTKKGKVYTFDSVECMVAFVSEGSVASDQIHSTWVTDFNNPNTLIDAQEAFYLKSGNLRSPMAVNITAFASKADLEAAKVKYDGLELLYGDLANIVAESGFAERVHGHMTRQNGNPQQDSP